MAVCLKANVHSGTAGQAGRGKWALRALCLVPAAAAAAAAAVGRASGHQTRTIYLHCSWWPCAIPFLAGAGDLVRYSEFSLGGWLRGGGVGVGGLTTLAGQRPEFGPLDTAP